MSTHQNSDQKIDLTTVAAVGEGLVRPECVLATADGDLYTADWRGGVAHIKPDGRQELYLGATADLAEGLKPNGIAFEPDGSFLIANLGSDVGGVWRLDRAGQVRPILIETDRTVLPPSNFCVRDGLGRLWLTVSTTVKPRALDYRRDAKSGFIVLQDKRGTRIVADGLGFTNEALVDPSGEYLYVNETYGRRFSRFRLKPNGDLGPKEVVAEFGRGQFPDGFAFDVDGFAWITSIVSNQLIRVELATGAAEVILEDADEGYVAWFEEAFQMNCLDRPFIDTILSQKLKHTSSIAFGGKDLQTAYLGNLLDQQIHSLRLPVAGVPPVHWRYPLK